MKDDYKIKWTDVVGIVLIIICIILGGMIDTQFIQAGLIW